MFSRRKYPKFDSLMLHLQSITAVAIVALTRTDKVKQEKRSLEGGTMEDGRK